MTTIKGPMSPQDAEVIAGMLKEAAANWLFQHNSPCTSGGLSDKLNDMAAAVLAAAREPLQKGWAALDKNGEVITIQQSRHAAIGWAARPDRVVRVAVYDGATNEC